MSADLFRASVRIARPASEVFAWHEKPGAFERLLAPWERVEVVSASPSLADGSRVTLRTRIGAQWLRWEVEHRDYVAGRQFRDIGLQGPFPEWNHLHRVDALDAATCTLTDEIRYRLPGGAAGRFFGRAYVKRKLERLFAYRHAVTKADLELHREQPVKRVLVAGASGLVGRALVPFLTTQGHEAIKLVRRKPRAPDEIRWEPSIGQLDAGVLDGIDAVVNLSGANVAAQRWTDDWCLQIEQSRIQSARTLVQTMQKMHTKPSVFVCASAVGYYGNCADRVLTESEPRGENFLARVCGGLEKEATVAQSFGVRVVNLRTGVVLTPAGGMLGKLVPLFRSGLGGSFGDPETWIGWISMDDHISAILHAMIETRLSGAVNSVAPEPVRVKEFATELAHALHRPSVFHVPRWALTTAFGMMAVETILSSQRAVPARLLSSGFKFRHPTLMQALTHGLGAPPSSPRVLR